MAFPPLPLFLLLSFPSLSSLFLSPSVDQASGLLLFSFFTLGDFPFSFRFCIQSTYPSVRSDVLQHHLIEAISPVISATTLRLGDATTSSFSALDLFQFSTAHLSSTSSMSRCFLRQFDGFRAAAIRSKCSPNFITRSSRFEAVLGDLLLNTKSVLSI